MELVAIHNITKSKFHQAMNIGGFPMPSIAVTTPEANPNDFGEISVIFGGDTVDPNINDDNHIYESDIYSSRFPRILYRFDEKTLNKALSDEFGLEDKPRNIINLNDNINFDIDESVSVFLQYYAPELKDKMSKDEAKDWLIDHATEKRVRNNVDIYEDNGDRRAFNKIGNKYTLSNIVKQMDKGRGQENVFSNNFAVSSWKARIARDITIQDAEYKGVVNPEKEKERYKEVGKAVEAVRDILFKARGGGRDLDFQELVELDDDALNIRPDMTDRQISTILGGNKYYLTDDDLALIHETAEAVRDLPVSYMEAKPERAVMMNEVKALVIPKDIDKGLLAQIEKTFKNDNIHIVQYDKEIEGDRARVTTALLEKCPELSLSGDINRRNQAILAKQAEDEKAYAIDREKRQAELSEKREAVRPVFENAIKKLSSISDDKSTVDITVVKNGEEAHFKMSAKDLDKELHTFEAKSPLTAMSAIRTQTVKVNLANLSGNDHNYDTFMDINRKMGFTLSPSKQVLDIPIKDIKSFTTDKGTALLTENEKVNIKDLKSRILNARTENMKDKEKKQDRGR